MAQHITLMVPEGHAVQVHPPGVMPHAQTGMIHDPAAMGAKAVMDAALPVPNEQKVAPSAKTQPSRKKKPAEKVSKLKGEGTEGTGGKEKTPR